MGAIIARPSKNVFLDLTLAHELTAGLIERLCCPVDKQQAFLRDSKAPGLRVRVTSPGTKSYVYEGKLGRTTIRRTIGDTRHWGIEAARAQARKLAVLLDQGIDPREQERQQVAKQKALQNKQALQAKVALEVWQEYIQQRKPYWGERHYKDHLILSQAGNERTQPGPLTALLSMRLVELNSSVIEVWVKQEAPFRPARIRLALRLLKAFLHRAATEPAYTELIHANAASSKKIRDAVGKPQSKDDCLPREQLSAWFAAIQQIQNPVISAYPQTFLLTGTRREELASLEWEDINFRWRGISIKDKVEEERTIPLTTYIQNLIDSLPRRNQWVFPAQGVRRQVGYRNSACFTVKHGSALWLISVLLTKNKIQTLIMIIINMQIHHLLTNALIICKTIKNTRQPKPNIGTIFE